ncbi:MAG: LuxR C-terminal-related transcriptional regulator [Treponema sp.]|jgi:LuxR family maltose regulon positive regulatory protein|nr:LuxR C-terminal-related transcriptional regulator [Treponema sp.]
MPNDLFFSNISLIPKNQPYLDRPRIHNLLEKAAHSPIITVTAGAGYGKTRAVYSFARKYNAITIWLQLFERDNLGWSFWGNFCRAVEFIGSDTAEKLREIGFPDTDQKFDQYLRIPRSYVLTDWKYIFVYDDFHRIRNPGVLRFIERCVTSPFPNISSVLISRTETGLNTVPMLSKGFLTRITEDDLRFTPEETREYFRIQGLDVDSGAYDDVCRDVEGWALAAHLAALTLKKLPPGDSRVLPPVKLNIINLIESEVISVISADLRKFLIKISLIDHLSMDILSDIAGETTLLEELGRIGSFVSYDPYLHIWQIYRLFLEYLNGRQGELSDEEKHDVYFKAAQWCAANNLKIDALSYYEKAGAYEKVFDILHSLPLLLPKSSGEFLLEILDRAPESLFTENPEASLARMRIFISLERFEEADVGLRAIIARLEAEPSGGDNNTLARCYVNLGLSGFMTCMHTCDYSYVRSFQQAYHYYQQTGEESGSNTPVAMLSSYLCRVHSAEQGEMERYIAALEAAIPLALAGYGGVAYGMDDLARAELAFFRNDQDKAEQMAYQALFKAQEKNQFEIAGRAIFYLMRINIAGGNPGKVAELIKQAEALLNEPLYLNRYIYYDIQLGWLYSQIGRTGKIAPWLANDLAENNLNSIASGLDILVRSKYYYVRGEYAKAMEAIEKDSGKYSLGGFLLGRIARRIMEAVCLYAMKDVSGATLAMEEAYALALPNGFDMPFIEHGINLRPLYAAALKSRRCSIPQEWLTRMLRAASAYAKKLYTAAENFRDEQSKDKTPTVFLRRRELSVLVGLSRGLTRQELAKAVNISINTVKSVIKSVYNKLGAVNSADAVRIATSMGILQNSDPGRDDHRIKKVLTTNITQEHFS